MPKSYTMLIAFLAQEYWSLFFMWPLYIIYFIMSVMNVVCIQKSILSW